MASITTRPNGHRWIQFRGSDGKRKTVRLGRVSKRQAQDVRSHVERLISANLMGTAVDPHTAQWVGELSPELRDKLAANGLVTGQPCVTLGELWQDFLGGLDVDPSTLRNLAVVWANLQAHFGADQRIRELTPADARAFRAWLGKSGGKKGGPLAEATVSRRARRAKQLFKHALDRRWTEENPFADQAGWNEVNRAKDFYVTLDIVARVLEQIPSLEFRALFIVARFGGLRCPSEVLPLTWDAVDWGAEVLKVLKSKTGPRLVPLFPEMRESLTELWGHATEGQPLIFPRNQITNSALSSKLGLACRRAGLALWPRPWKNLRATRESELLEEFPIQVVTDWLGHTPKIALEHYTQVSKEHHARAVKMRKSVLRPPRKSTYPK